MAAVPGVLKEWSVNLKGSAINSQGINGYISVMVALKFTNCLIKGLIFFQNNRITSLIGYMLISYDR